MAKLVTLQAPQAATPIVVPEAGLIGLGRDFADLYGAYLESPRAFFYFAFLTYFGALVANLITLESALHIQARLYTILLGESASTRKSTVLDMVNEFFKSLGLDSGQFWELSTLFGVGSAEGLAAALKDAKDGSLLLGLDEFKTFADKARIQNSVLLPMVSTLFERRDYDSRTKESNIHIRGVSLSLLAACTLDTYAAMFGRQFHDIGFLNRLWLVVDRPTRRVALPSPLPESALTPLRNRVEERLGALVRAWQANKQRPVPYAFVGGAKARWEQWYSEQSDSIFAKRLDTYGFRLMLLLAAMTDRTAIDAEIVERVIALLDYQFVARRETHPIDAYNTMAIIERKLRRGSLLGVP